MEWIFPYENSEHMKRQGRQAKGEKIKKSKLIAKEVLEIRKRCNMGQLQKDIAKDFNIYFSTVHKIKNKLTWKHI